MEKRQKAKETSKEFETCGIIPLGEGKSEEKGGGLTLDKLLAYEIGIDNYEPWFQKVAKQAENENGKLAVHLRNGAKVVFADFRLPNDMLCIPSSSFDLLPSQVLMFLVKDNLPTEDVEMVFVGGTIVRKRNKEDEDLGTEN